MSERPILELEQVTVGYRPGEAVLHEVSMELHRGEVAAVVSLDVGGSKTTLLKAAAGLLPPSSGRVLFDGADVYRMGFGADQRFRGKCAVVLEGGALLVNRTVWENVALPLRYHGARSRRELAVTVERLLAQCGFNEDPLALPWQISDRGQRLAAFARALARDPILVLVDRFFEGLEMPDWRRLFELVMELNQNQGVSWLLVSEVDPAIFQVAERVAVLEEGRLIAHAHRRKLYEQTRLRAAFEAGEMRPTRSRTQRADVERVRALTVSSGRVSPLVTESSGDALGGSDDFEATISIDGILPEAPSPLRSRSEVLDLEFEPTIDLDPRTVDLDADGRGGTISVDAEGDPTIFVGSSDAHPPLPEAPAPRGRSGARTVEMEAPTIPEADADAGPARPEPPRERPRKGAATVEMAAPSVDDTPPPRKRPAKGAATVEMEAPHVPDEDEEPRRPRKRPAKGAATVEMEAPHVPDEDEEPPVKLSDPAAAARKKPTKKRRRPRAGDEEA